MNYKKNTIKNGIELHTIETPKFKTNLFAIFLTTPLNRANITKNALISTVLRRGTAKLKSQDAIAKELENMYGASFDCGVDKHGDNHVLKFYLESINDEFLPQKDELAKKSLDLLSNIVFNPNIENNCFKKDYVEGEKNTLKQIIEGKIDNKTKYALDRCIEEMFKNEVFGLYKFGYVEDLDGIDEKNLYEYYKELINNCKIDVFVSGYNIQNIGENEILSNLNERKGNIIPTTARAITSSLESPKIVSEKMDITQGKLMIGLDVLNTNEDEAYIASVYNVILGGGANSKLFQNVREKASLAYTAGSSYLKAKNSVFIRCGIDVANYDKAISIIKDQLVQIENGDFSDNDLESAKQIIYASVKSIPDSQDGEIIYYFAQGLSNKFVNIDEYIQKIKSVTKEQVIEVAKKVKINTIYFLGN